MPGRTDETASDVPMEDGALTSHQPETEEEFEDAQQFPDDDEDDTEQRVKIVRITFLHKLGLLI